MHKKSTLRHKRIIVFIVFVTCCVLLTLFYYDVDILSRCDEFVFKNENIDNNNISVKNNYNKRSSPIIIFTTHYNKSSTSSVTLIPSVISFAKNKSTTPSQSSKPKKITISSTTRPRPFQNETSSDLKFIVSSNNCKMPDLDPFNDEAKRYFKREHYKSCSNKDLLTYVTKTANNLVAILHINSTVVPSYEKKKNGLLTCCYSNVTRKKSNQHPDDNISVSSCHQFEGNLTLPQSPVIVRCHNEHKKQVYENAHYAITITEDVQKKLINTSNYDNNSNNNNNNNKTAQTPASILFIGIDSISRLNLIRTMPHTYKYLIDTKWLTLKGYNKMDDNTFPNLMAIFTGYDSDTAYKICEPKVVGKLDQCPFIWRQFARYGYITCYAEDESTISTFNYNKVGFAKPPLDYYLRPYIMASEKLNLYYKDSLKYCTGPETAGERIMNAAKDFAVTFKNYPSFGFFWMNSFSHSDVNTPGSMDDKVLKLFKDLDTNGVLEKSIVIFLSDHGIRFGAIRKTNTGWLEERLPFIFIWFPKWFQLQYPNEISNFKLNINRLTNPYDLHMTLQHILQLSGDKNYTIIPSNACPKCKSLFDVMDADRSCEDAAITSHWCTCNGYTNAKFSNNLKNRIIDFMLAQIHNAIRSRKHEHKCAKYSVEKVHGIRVAQKRSNENETLVLVQLELNPKAIFESTILLIVNNNNNTKGDNESQKFVLTGDISRLDSYFDVSTCIKDSYLRKYCYCRTKGERI